MLISIYSRVSTNKQDSENQLQQLKKYAKKKHYEIYKFYVETISGREEKRPKFLEMMEDGRLRRFNHLLFWDLTRFSRAGLQHVITNLNKLTLYDITWESFVQPELNTSNKLVRDILLSVYAYFGKYDSEIISLRTKASIEKRKKEGLPWGRPVGSKDKKPRKKAGYIIKSESTQRDEKGRYKNVE